MPFKEATFWYGTILFTTGIYFWIEGGDRVTIGVALTVFGIAMSIYAVIAEHYPSLPRLRVWVALLFVTWGALGYDIYDRHVGHPSSKIQTFDWTIPLTQIRGAIFVNEKVDVDGKEFIDCTFNHVTFVYNGTAPFGMSHNTIIKPIQFSTDSDSVAGATVLYKSTGVLEPNFDITNHHKLLPNIEAPTIKGSN